MRVSNVDDLLMLWPDMLSHEITETRLYSERGTGGISSIEFLPYYAARLQVSRGIFFK